MVLFITRDISFLVLIHIVFSGVRVTRSLVLSVCFVDRCLLYCPFTFDHCVVCRFTDSNYLSGIFKLLLLVGCPTKDFCEFALTELHTPV